MFSESAVKARIRAINGYPKKGILFMDITTLIKDAGAFQECINELAGRLASINIEYIVGIEARGFITGSALAYKMNKGFIPVRKKGKLPYETIGMEYVLEYGTDTIEMHRDALESGSNIVIADDLLATGGTAKAVSELVEKAGGTVSAFAFIVELEDLKGREKINDYKIISLVKY